MTKPLDTYQIESIRQIRNELMAVVENLTMARADAQQLSIEVNGLLTMTAEAVAARMPEITERMLRLHATVHNIDKDSK